jgi:hypothetical protein
VLRDLEALSPTEALLVAVEVQQYAVQRASAEPVHLSTKDGAAREGEDLRVKFARELDRLPLEASFSLLDDLLVRVCLDGETSVAEFERTVLTRMRTL